MCLHWKLKQRVEIKTKINDVGGGEGGGGQKCQAREQQTSQSLNQTSWERPKLQVGRGARWQAMRLRERLCGSRCCLEAFYSAVLSRKWAFLCVCACAVCVCCVWAMVSLVYEIFAWNTPTTSLGRTASVHLCNRPIKEDRTKTKNKYCNFKMAKSIKKKCNNYKYKKRRIQSALGEMSVREKSFAWRHKTI